MATWVLEREVFSDGDQALADAIVGANGRVLQWRDDWWLDGRWPKGPDQSVLFHGSLANADRIARELPWKPGSYCSTDRFACSAWWPSVSAHLVATRYVVTTASGLVDLGVPEEFGDRLFVRPDSPLKPFSGRVLERGRISLASLDHGFYYDDAQLPVVVTPAVDVGEEWRFVVVAGRIVAGSEYAADGRRAGTSIRGNHPAWAYAENVLVGLSHPDPVFVMDVCETGAGLRLLELNPFSGADLYGCDRSAIVDAVQGLTG